MLAKSTFVLSLVFAGALCQRAFAISDASLEMLKIRATQRPTDPKTCGKYLAVTFSVKGKLKKIEPGKIGKDTYCEVAADEFSPNFKISIFDHQGKLLTAKKVLLPLMAIAETAGRDGKVESSARREDQGMRTVFFEIPKKYDKAVFQYQVEDLESKEKTSLAKFEVSP